MLTDVTLAAATVWLLALVVAALTVRRWTGSWAHAHPIFAIAGVAALARAVPTVRFHSSWFLGTLDDPKSGD